MDDLGLRDPCRDPDDFLVNALITRGGGVADLKAAASTVGDEDISQKAWHL